MKRKSITGWIDNRSFWVSGGRPGGGVKQHSITMIVIPEEFLPPLGRKEVICFFFLESSHQRQSYELISLNSIFGTGMYTMF